MRTIATLSVYLASLCLLGGRSVTQVAARAPQHAHAASALAISGQTRPQTKTGTISGRVLGEDGGAIEGASVSCASLDGVAANRIALTDGEGQFSFTGLSLSTYRLVASLAGYVAETSGGPDRVVRIGDNVTLNLAKGGVITGKVTDATGNPVVAVSVSAQGIKDADGKPLRGVVGSRSRQTDDRGIYRIYGLTAGTYVVVANPGEYHIGMATAYDYEIATFYPSSNRDGAAEVMVQQGAEATSIDIRYRDVQGHIISGTIDAGARTAASEFTVMVMANPANGPATSDFAIGTLTNGVRVFAINGLIDGDYDIVASGGSFTASVLESYSGPARRVSVRGGDVSGVRLTIAPGVSIAGKVAIEATPIQPETCPSSRESSLTETVIKASRDEKTLERDPYEVLASRASGAVNEKGEFLLRNLKAGSHRFLADFPNDSWYLKTITMPAATATRTVDLGRIPLTTRAGDKISNVSIMLGEGAASLKGNLSATRTKRGLWRIHVVPVAIGEADNVLVYYESTSSVDGGFTFTNIAPGKYWISVRPVAEEETSVSQVRPVAWDATERANLRREAEATKNVVDLKSCQRVKDLVLD
jgi:hypothetical protein